MQFHLWEKSQNLTFKSEITERTKFYKNKWNFFIKWSFFPIPTLHNKKKSANLGPKNSGLKLEKSANIFCLKIGRNFFYAKWVWGRNIILWNCFIYYWKKLVRSVISLSKARFCDFSHMGYGNGFFETIASKPHILRAPSRLLCCWRSKMCLCSWWKHGRFKSPPVNEDYVLQNDRWRLN